MPGPHQIRAGVFPGPDQIPGRLLGLGGHPHPSQLPDVQQPGQPLGVAPVGLDPIPGGRFSLEGATTTHRTPAICSALASPNPVGPASYKTSLADQFCRFCRFCRAWRHLGEPPVSASPAVTLSNENRPSRSRPCQETCLPASSTQRPANAPRRPGPPNPVPQLEAGRP